MNNKSPVTVSPLESYKDIVEGLTCFQRYVYVECSLCEGMEHLSRVAVSYEKDKEGKIVFSSIDFQFPAEAFVDLKWAKISKTRWGRFVQGLESFRRRVVVACCVLFRRGVIYISPSMDLSIASTRLLGQKLIEVADEAEKGAGA